MKKTATLFLLTLVLFTAAQAQYCMLPGRTYYGNLQPGIKNFKLNTINRTSSAVELALTSPPVIVTTDSTTLQRGKTYTVTIVHTRDSISFPTARNHIRVWIDYNNDKDFDDAGETAISADFQTYGTYTGSFTVPATAPLGITKLRVTAKMSQDAGHTTPTSCDMPADPIGYHGEMEDYKVNILPGVGINEINETSLNATVFPNPAANDITLVLEENRNAALAVELYDIAGKLIGRMLNEPKQTTTSYHFELNKYTSAQGIYFLKVSSGDAYSYQKIIKTN